MDRAVALPNTRVGHGHVTQHGQCDERIVDSRSRIGVVAATELEVRRERALVARLALANRREVLGDHLRGRRRRLTPGRQFELLARPRVVAEHEVAARKLEARRFVPRLQQDETLEGEHAFGGVARMHRRDPEEQVELGLAEPLGGAPVELIGGFGLALVDQRPQLLRRLRPCRRAKCRGRKRQRATCSPSHGAHYSPGGDGAASAARRYTIIDHSVIPAASQISARPTGTVWKSPKRTPLKRRNGIANSCDTVFTFPRMFTATLFDCPICAIHSRSAEMVISRPMMMSEANGSTMPFSVSTISAAATMSLSATGSRNAPNDVVWFQRRAR